MKNKKNIKILLPVVVIIWGLFLYKLIGALNPDAPDIVPVKSSAFKVAKVQAKDTFELLPIERDPFLGTLVRSSKKTPSRSTTPSKKTSTPWPNINYLGSVSDNEGRLAVFVVMIEGEEQLLKRGETAKDVKLVKGNEEWISLKFNGESRKFSLQ